MSQTEPAVPDGLLHDIRRMIDDTRAAVASAVNAGLAVLYWQIGNRVRREILQGGRAGYGEQVLVRLSRELVTEYGQGFAEKNLRRMVQFAEVFPDSEIVVTLSRQLSWSHFMALLPLREPLQREFYAEMCRVERWSVRVLRRKIDSMLYERTALSRKPDVLIREELSLLRGEDRLTPDLVFRDPYVLEFLGLRDRYLERDLEDAIMREIESFLLELGSGFSFVARQKRITVDQDDYYLDLLFFHRGLRRLVAIELKLGDFKPADKGQMELYLRWLARYEMQPGEELPIGLILCAGRKRETVELLQMEESGIRVAEYLTELPPKDVLARRLHAAIDQARARLAPRGSEDT
jgi:predicted nuclease of restriction endonuclease-like (RecB) superfamily